MKPNLRKLVYVLLAVGGIGSAAFGQGGRGTISVIYYAPAWGPDTNGAEVVYFLKQVTFQSAATEQSRIYFCSIRPDGSGQREIAWLWKDKPDQFLEPFAMAAHMEINAATKRVALGVELGERGGVFVFNLDGTGFQSVWPKEWKEDRPAKAGYPTWSPNGKWLAFQEYRFEKGWHLYRIVKCRTDSSDYKPLTERNEINKQPAWSPTGDWIAYVGDYIANTNRNIHAVNLWLMKPDGTEKRDTKQWGRYPRWSPDGKLILHSGIVVFDVAANKRVKVWDGPWIFPKWGVNGFVSGGPGDVSLADSAGKTTRPLLKNSTRSAGVDDLEKETLRW